VVFEEAEIMQHMIIVHGLPQHTIATWRKAF
jgi:hypothetical protein